MSKLGKRLIAAAKEGAEIARIRPVPMGDRLDDRNKDRPQRAMEACMPAQTIRSSASSQATTPLNGHYPKFLASDGGNVWLVTAPKTGVLLVMNSQPFRNKRVGVGYATSKLKESVALRPYHGRITLDVA